MTSTIRSGPAAVHWLTAQSFAFGVMAALLGIVANAMFLDAYGSGWLPATYIAIGAAGILVSGTIARLTGRFDLLGIAFTVLAGAAAGLVASWAVAADGSAPWVSIPLVVLFPVLIQLGFVFIGGQAGRLLDIAQIKASFPRIMTGFPVGAVVGGLLGAQLVTALGRTEDLLLATAVAQAAFAGLLLVTGRRYASQLGSPGSGPAADTHAQSGAEPGPGSFRRRLFGGRFVMLILAYQVLSALGSQLSDFLVFDRATAQFQEAVDLARFLAAYTALMNATSIVFLFVVAGPLLRRFGLRLGIAANPLVLTVLSVGMVVVYAVTGAMSFALLGIVSAARIADIALTDGTTRTSINATYQVLPERPRLAVQTAVEGIGVPVAIGISGVLILALNTLPFALAATITATLVVCAVWTWAGLLLYRSYGPALARAVRRRPLLVPASDLHGTAQDEIVVRELLSSHDLRATQLGLELLGAMSSPALGIELAALADDPRADVRLSALAAMSASGDAGARRRLAGEVRAGAASDDPVLRLRAARALEALDREDRRAAVALLEDDDVAIRCAALDSVRSGDTFAVEPVVAALGDTRTLGSAAGAVARLGDAVVPLMATCLDGAGSPAPSPVTRLVRSAATSTPARDDVLRRHVGHHDRELGLAVMERLVAVEPAGTATATAIDAVLPEDVGHGARLLAALVAFDAPGEDARDADGPVRRALADELDLVRRRLVAGRLARHGSGHLGPVMVALQPGGSGGALAAEALDVLLGSDARQVVPLILPGLTAAERLHRLRGTATVEPADVSGWLRDLVEDPGGRWRSPWLRACAVHAAAARGLLGQCDLTGARALGDTIVDEELAASTPSGGG